MFLGHMDPMAIRDMISQGLVEGIVLESCDGLRQRDACMKAKFSRRLPFPEEVFDKSFGFDPH